MSNRPLDHWVCIPDEDLKYIQDGPEDRRNIGSVLAWVDEVLDVIDDGLETA